MGHLNRRQFPNAYRGAVFLILFNILIIKLHNTPDAATEQAVELFRIFICNRDVLQTEIRKLRFVNVFLNVQTDGDLVDNRVTTFGAQH